MCAVFPFDFEGGLQELIVLVPDRFTPSAPKFQSCYFWESSCMYFCYILVFIFISMFLRYYIHKLGMFHANQTTKRVINQSRTKYVGWSTTNILKPPPPTNTQKKYTHINFIISLLAFAFDLLLETSQSLSYDFF